MTLLTVNNDSQFSQLSLLYRSELKVQHIKIIGSYQEVVVVVIVIADLSYYFLLNLIVL